MKKIIILALTAFMGYSLHAQVVIAEDGQSTVPTNSSVLLEFRGVSPRGIILPAVESVNNPDDGTFIYNMTDESVQVYEDGAWTVLTKDGEGVNPDSYINNGGTDVGGGVIIGSDTSAKEGVLILESPDKAMVLPHVKSPHKNMPKPIAGTMVYDEDADMLAVFDGSNWHYWSINSDVNP